MAVLWDIGWRVRILGLILLGLGAVLYIDAQVSCSHVDLSALCVAVNPETPIGLMLIAAGIVTMTLGFVETHNGRSARTDRGEGVRATDC